MKNRLECLYTNNNKTIQQQMHLQKRNKDTYLSELSDRQAVALLELFLQLGQGVGAECCANVHNTREQTRAKFLKGRYCEEKSTT